MNTIIKALAILLISLSILTACGGGSGSETPQQTTGSSDWDSLVWDQDNWE